MANDYRDHAGRLICGICGDEVAFCGRKHQRTMKLEEIVDQCGEDAVRWFGDNGDLINATLGLAGEIGEFVDEVKKRYRKGLLYEGTTDAQAEELTDVFIYTCILASKLGVDLASQYEKKREFNERRFGHTATKQGFGVRSHPREAPGDALQ